MVLISKLLGFLREMVIAERFGTSREYDIFLIAIAAPVFFNVVIVRAANYLMVPFLSGKLSNSSDESTWREIWSVLNSLVTVAVILVLLIVAAAPLLVQLIGPGLEGESLAKAIFYCRAISILVFLGFLESFLRSTLHVKKHFVYPVVGSIILNAVIITVIYLLSARLSVGAILVGLIIGTFLQVIFLTLKLWNPRIVRQFNVHLFDREVRAVLSVGGLVLAVEFLTSTYFLIDRYFASGLAEGVVSALNYSSLLVMLPVSIVGYAIASVTFPYLSERAVDDKAEGFSSLLHSALSLALVIALPCGVFYLFFSRELTAAVFLRGAFDLESLEKTSTILATLTPYLVCLFLYAILVQACYSAGRQKAVFVIALASVILKFVLTALFTSLLGYPGIALATSVVLILSAGLLIMVLVKGGRLADTAGLSVSIAKVMLASLPIVVIWFFYKDLPDFQVGMGFVSKIRVVWAAVLSFLFFMAISYILKIDEIRSLFIRPGRRTGGMRR